MKKVAILGDSGFIGSYITKAFLENGYEVKVSSTDISKKEKYQHLMELGYSEHLNISEVNMENKAATTSGLHGENYLLSSESYPVSDIGLMLNNKAPKNMAKIIYQNTKAARKFGIPFQPALRFLQE